MWSSGGSGGGAVGGMVTGKPGEEREAAHCHHTMPSALYRCTCVAMWGGRKGCPI